MSVLFFQQILTNERYTQALVYKIRDFYFTERLYLLQCLKVILNNWQNEEHPYKLLENCRQLTESALPTWETNSVLMTSGQAYIWAMQNLKEQCETLEMLMIYMKDFSVTVDKVVNIMELFKASKHGFGKRQSYKHILDDNLDVIVQRIGKVDKVMQLFGSEPSHGPLLLLWSAVRMSFSSTDGLQLTRKMGNKSRQLDVYQYILNLLGSEPFSHETSFVSAVAHYLVYQMLAIVLSTFDEGTIAYDREVQVLHKVLCHVMKKPYVAEQFWTLGLETGLGSVLQEALGKFPLDFASLVQFSTSLASAGQDSAQRVFDLWQKLTMYTEYLDQNSPSDLVCIRDNTMWKLIRNKIPYPSKDFKIDAGTFGQEIGLGGRHGDSPIIQWDVTYNGFELLLCEIETLLDQVSLGSGMVATVAVVKVTLIAKFIEALSNSIPQCIRKLAPITESMYQLISRFARLGTPPLDLIAGSVSCLACMAKREPFEVWHKMKQTGFFPYLTENVDNLVEVLSGNVGLSSGSYGAILAGLETAQGFYPVTSSFLNLFTIFIEPFHTKGRQSELMAPMLFILREIFPVFQKWRFYQPRDLEVIGKSCLNIFMKVLNINNTGKTSANKGPKLREVCIYCLLFTEAGRALLEIIATGSDNVEMALAQQGSIADQGTGAELIDLIQLSFSILNRLLTLKSPDLPVSPVENALSSQPVGRQTRHIVATIAQYIYHKHNPKLPALACKLLQRLAMGSRMSILACLGGDAEAIRDMYLTRLHAVTEDLPLKVVILEFLSVCVEAQPGLIEIFLNVYPQVTASTTTPGSTSSQGQKETYRCPPDLLCACMDFIKSLWVGLRETAMSVLRARKHFWPSVCAPVSRDLETPSSNSQVHLPHKIKTIASALRILSEEIYAVTSSKLDPNLKSALSNVGKSNRVQYWSGYVQRCLVMEAERKEADVDNISENYTLKLLIAWKNFTITVAKNEVEDLKITDGVKEMIIVDLLEGIQALVEGNYTKLNIKLAQIASAQLFTIMKTWTGCLSNRGRIMTILNAAINQTLSSSASLLPPVQLGLLGALTTILQYQREVTAVALGSEVVSVILPTVCDLLLQSTRELPPPKDLASQSQTSSDLHSADVRLKMQVLAVCLLEEVILQCSSRDLWLPVLQENLIFSSLLASLELFIQGKQGVHYVHAAFLLLLTIAKDEKGADSLAMSGFTQHICLAALMLYDDKDLIPVPQTRCLELSRITFQETAILEAEKTCDLIYELSHFLRQWRLHLGEVMIKLQTSMLYMSQTFIAFLMRPRYLQHVLDQNSGTNKGQVKRLSPKQPRLQQQSSTEDLERPSQHLVHIQHRMLVILGRSLSALRQFTPDVCEILYEQCMDYTEYEPFLAIGFTPPSTDQDSPPSFGTLMSCVRDVCVGILNKLEPRGSTSPHRSGSDSNIVGQIIPKGVIQYIMENALYIIISQSTRYIRDPSLPVSDKQLLKRELGTEMNHFLMELQRYLKHTAAPSSPSSARQPSPRPGLSGATTLVGRSLSQTAFLNNPETEFFEFVREFVTSVLK
ncbi:hypothetical protein FSP39_001128 [Pinctada imbricata]|uniref:Nucleoporin NUP188 n=1 Tax=Pinctada imbricata TaxID=66713 RepID=A0AA89BTR5_PINIB|nr:hypothetical protein FSP39_001128 [Pinctada imbricata]